MQPLGATLSEVQLDQFQDGLLNALLAYVCVGLPFLMKWIIIMMSLVISILHIINKLSELHMYIIMMYAVVFQSFS